MLVCRAWFTDFARARWAIFSLSEQSVREVPLEVWLKYHSLVRTLIIREPSVLTVLDSYLETTPEYANRDGWVLDSREHCPNLIHIEVLPGRIYQSYLSWLPESHFSVLNDDEDEVQVEADPDRHERDAVWERNYRARLLAADKVLELLDPRYHPNVRAFTWGLHAEAHNDRLWQGLMLTQPSNIPLTLLTLCNTTVRVSDLNQLLGHCPRLTTLYVESVSFHFKSNVGAVLDLGHVRTFSLRRHEGATVNPFQVRGHNLKKMMIYSRIGCQLQVSFWDCPLLQEILLDGHWRDGEAMSIKKLLVQCHGLLESLTLHYCQVNFGPTFVQDVLMQHQATLKNITFVETFSIASKDIQTILANCENLESFLIDQHFLEAKDIQQPEGSNQQSSASLISPRTHHTPVWSCRNITMLSVAICIPLCAKSSDYRGYVSTIYSALSFLTQLNTIDLSGCRSKVDRKQYWVGVPWTLESGMHSLLQLKQMERLMLTGWEDDIQKDDILWMRQYWPRLQKISGWDENSRPPLQIPEILQSIVQHLPHQDQVRCLSVSWAFHDAIVPNIWRRIILEDRTRYRRNSSDYSFPTGPALQRYKHHIHELQIWDQYLSEYLTIQGCDRLQVLTVRPSPESFDPEEIEEEDIEKLKDDLMRGVSDIVAAHTCTLRELVIELPWAEGPETPHSLWEGLSRCQPLEVLNLSSVDVSQESSPLFHRVCERASRVTLTNVLNLHWGGSLHDQPHAIEDDNSHISLLSQSLASLSLASNEEHDQHEKLLTKELNISSILDDLVPNVISAFDQAMMFRRQRNLKILRWRVVGCDTNLDHSEWTDVHSGLFMRTLALTPWPLHHLESLELSWSRLEDQDLSTVLSHMHQLRSLQVSHTRFGQQSFQELFKDPCAPRTLPLCQSLEVLYINECDAITSSMVQRILESCPKLLKLRADRITVTDISRGKEWVCKDLIIFHVYIQVDTEEVVASVNDVDACTTVLGPGDVQLPEEMEQMQRKVFSRLGGLTKLEILTILSSRRDSLHLWGRMTSLDLRLCKGLDLLAGLKRLSLLVFSFAVPQQMGVEDARWMVANWPLLEHVSGLVNRDKDIAQQIWPILHIGKCY
ncbi:hypothetical protein EDD11_005031 [Mortierella claussenii]|nr:hypothetical protein EDD11_005031 [Mortierella claussenii]